MEGQTRGRGVRVGMVIVLLLATLSQWMFLPVLGLQTEESARASSCTSVDVLADCIEPSVLRLRATFDDGSTIEGSGFVVASDGTGTYVLTNKHVVSSASPSQLKAITSDGKTAYDVRRIVLTDLPEGSAGDLAMLLLPPTSLAPLEWGDSSGLLLLQKVISIGYGEGSNLPGPPSATEGVVSALRRDMGDGFGGVWIQHQSFINHGNSGGPLLDAQYHVVGVNTLGGGGQTQGIFLAIPSSLARIAAGAMIRYLTHTADGASATAPAPQPTSVPRPLQSASVLYAQGRALLARGDNSGALAAFSAALQVNPLCWPLVSSALSRYLQPCLSSGAVESRGNRAHCA